MASKLTSHHKDQQCASGLVGLMGPSIGVVQREPIAGLASRWFALGEPAGKAKG